MKELSSHNSAKRKYCPPSQSPVWGRRTEPAVRADTEVVIYVWGISLFHLLFLGLLGSVGHLVLGLVITPFAATTGIALSKMGGGKVWSWFIAMGYTVCCLFWLIFVTK